MMSTEQELLAALSGINNRGNDFITNLRKDQKSLFSDYVKLFPNLLYDWGKNYINKDFTLANGLTVKIRDTPTYYKEDDSDSDRYIFKFPIDVHNNKQSFGLITTLDLMNLTQPLTQTLESAIWKVSVLRDEVVAKDNIKLKEDPPTPSN